MSGQTNGNVLAATKSVAIAGSGIGLGATINWAAKHYWGVELPTDMVLFLAFCLTVGSARIWSIVRQAVLKKWGIDINGA